MIGKQHFKRLNVQLVAFLLLALLPLGSVAIYQTNRVALTADENANLALLALTERAARREEALIERAVGAARFFGLIAADLLREPGSCKPVLSRFVAANPDYSFVGVIPPTGIVECSSVNNAVDFRDMPNFEATMSKQTPTIVVNRVAPTSGESVFVVSEPFKVKGSFAGLVSVSIPHRNLPETRESLQNLGLIDLITFNEDGLVLTTREGVSAAANELPIDRDLRNLPTDRSRSFRSENRDGVERRYSVVPIAGTPATILAVWSLNPALSGDESDHIPASIFPVLMMFSSLGVAMLAMHTLVLRHLQRIGRDMDKFADDRTVQHYREDIVLLPLEIEKLSDNFARMSKEILEDEANLESSLLEKEVLIKEIHHRVKNNLQLISSVMNIQIRSAQHRETKDVLRRLQDRVLSLATIHRDLYQSQDGGLVDAAGLVREIVDKSAEMAISEGSRITVDTEIDDLRLFPDQAVPLSMLVAEAATNAMKYVGSDNDDHASIEVRLRQSGAKWKLVFANSIGDTVSTDSTGLGGTLMDAFAQQLGGELEIHRDDQRYVMELCFEALEFEPEVRNY
ncbi:histidine kinase dimerization/phosphoacceptor domain -containing protein [uncultured Sulfitobacter sp.]|uniref:histidine kinase dimerization/phosphoacceptor domain -containing protein n=1 Tax=uncultured Sulfitobacter sp. TaxID=191468 RepID=UPI002621BECB|nr:histidine kinase dimerization/phosphoacceptor domain -containing protein [uncultured Sulfitobacter sp.]